MSSQPKVSVIIPVYNVEVFIERCVNSLFGQTLDDIEYIFVDDCSPDDSIFIVQRVLEKYPHRKSQVKFVRHNVNEGVSKSRQDGIDRATGEYMIHCDPDDWIDANMYEELYENGVNNNSDIVICDFYYTTEVSESLSNQRPEELSNISIYKSISGASKHLLHGSLCNKLIKRNLYRKIRLPSDIEFCEDALALFQVLEEESIRVSYVDQGLYHYFVSRPNSIVKTINRESIRKDLILIERLLAKNTVNEIFYNCRKSYVIQIIFFRAFLYAKIDDKDFINEYGRFVSMIPLNDRISKIDKLLLNFAMRGHLSAARKIHFLLLGLYKYLKKIKK